MSVSPGADGSGAAGRVRSQDGGITAAHDPASARSKVGSDEARTERSLRVAVLNVQSGIGTTRGWWEYLARSRRDGSSRRRRIERIGSGLREAGAGLAILLEVDGGSARTGGIDQAELLARSSGLEDFAFFPCFQFGDEINQGNAVHAARPVDHVRNHELPGLGEPRYLSEARLRWNGRRIHVFAAHTSLKAAIRRVQLEEIHRIVTSCARPMLLGGDFNARKGRELDALATKLRRVSAGPTFPSWRPRWTLDHLFVSPHFSVRRARVHTGLRESDHLPLIVDLDFADGPMAPGGPAAASRGKEPT